MSKHTNTAFLLLTGFLSACDGVFLMHKTSCPDGKIQSGSLCVDATTTKAAIVDCLDPPLSELKAGTKTTMCDGSTGVGTYNVAVSSSSSSSTTSVACTSDGQVGCVTTTTFKSANTLNLSASDIRSGKTIAGVTGTKPDIKQCRNAANLSMFDISPTAATVRIPSRIASVAANTLTLDWTHGLTTNDRVQLYCAGGVGTQIGGGPVSVGTNYYVIVTSTTNIQLEASISGGALAIASTAGCTGTWTVAPIADSVAQYFDTIDDYNGLATTLTGPSTSPWGSDYVCNESNFTNKTGSAPFAPSNTIPTYANQSWTQIWKDELTGLYLTNILHYSGSSDWYGLSAMCTGLDSLNSGSGGTGWRLPTQKELMQIYINGISKVSLAGGTTQAPGFWSASGMSNNTRLASVVSLSNGYVNQDARNTTSNSAICVR